jgi:hypothetical protein
MTGAPQTLAPRIRPPPAGLARLPDSRPQSYACTGLSFHSTPCILNNPTLTLPCFNGQRFRKRQGHNGDSSLKVHRLGSIL